MSKKTVELSSKRKVQIREMGQDEIDSCHDTQYIVYVNGRPDHYANQMKARTAWLRKGIVGGDFKTFKTGIDGYPEDCVLKELKESEKNELSDLIQEFQGLGE
tara:strand:- start:112 stop:420 length:309 start_codon:yes stop_codon:yes gene_type:complete